MPGLSDIALGGVVLVAICVLLTIPYARWEGAKKRKKIEEAFAGRVPLGERAFYETYFRDKGVPEWVVGGVRRVLEDELEADLSRLSSADDFNRNLSFFWDFDSLADVKVVLRLEEEFGIKISDAEAGRAGTVEGIVMLVWSKIGAPAARP